MIADLRNPCLKERHWSMLEGIVGVSLLENPLNLDALQELRVFSHDVEIQEVREGGGDKWDKLAKA